MRQFAQSKNRVRTRSNNSSAMAEPDEDVAEPTEDVHVARPTASQSFVDSKGKIGVAEWEFEQGKLFIRNHGAPFVSFTEFLVPGAVLAKQIKNLVSSLEESGREVESIRLRSCYSANGGRASQAQCVADITGKMVVGYKGRVQMYESGSASSRGVSGEARGDSRVFFPQENSHLKNLTQVGNSLGYIPVSMGLIAKMPHNIIANTVRRINVRVRSDN